MTTATTPSEALSAIIEDAAEPRTSPHKPMKLRPEVKADWLKALRSGDYSQAKYALEKFAVNEGRGGFCCLGVLCKVGVDEGSLERDATKLNDRASYRSLLLPSYPTEDEDEFATGMPTNAIEAWAFGRFSSERDDDELVPFLVPSPEAVKAKRGIYAPEFIGLAELNDEFDFTFEMLADVIETHL